MGLTRALSIVVLSACSSGKPHAVEDAKRPSAGSDAPRADAPTVAPPPARSTTTGDVQVRVEWQKVPAAVRASPGTTKCATPRLAQVSPSTTWGIGDAVVFVDGAPEAPGEARVQLAACAFVPRVAIGTSLVVDSTANQPAELTLSHRAQAADLRARAAGTAARTIQLPIAGHAVSVALDAGEVYELAADGETAWIVAATAAITDGNGVALIKDVPVGEHAVRAWLPPRGGQPARHATGKVTVAAGDLSELTLQLAP